MLLTPTSKEACHIQLTFLSLSFSFTWKIRHSGDSIYQPQLGFACVSNRPHLFPEKSDAENSRYLNTDTWTAWVCVFVAHAWKCVHYIHVCKVLYVSVCTPLLDQGGFFSENKMKQNKAATCFIFSLISIHEALQRIFHSSYWSLSVPLTLHNGVFPQT